LVVVASDYDPAPPAAAAEGATEAPKKTKGLGDRLKQTAQRIRAPKAEGGSKAQSGGQTRAARKVTTPRKAGGS
jgi:hypothetical protein